MRQKRGLLEQAHGGTLFLDEIGDMPHVDAGQAAARAQERAVTRVGGEAAIPVDFRLICATHRDLRKLVEQGTFREDLFYRINVVHCARAAAARAAGGHHLVCAPVLAGIGP